MAKYAMGVAIINAIATHLTKFLFSNAIISVILAPLTFRMPISFVFLMIEKKLIAYNPIQAINIEIIDKTTKSFCTHIYQLNI